MVDFKAQLRRQLLFLQNSCRLYDEGHVEEAIRVGTINGAYASYEENLKGSLEAGKLADLVVLGRDPMKEDPSTLITIPVERTMAGGRWTFES